MGPPAVSLALRVPSRTPLVLLSANSVNLANANKLSAGLNVNSVVKVPMGLMKG
jgi:hypothetical protein